MSDCMIYCESLISSIDLDSFIFTYRDRVVDVVEMKNILKDSIIGHEFNRERAFGRKLIDIVADINRE